MLDDDNTEVDVIVEEVPQFELQLSTRWVHAAVLLDGWQRLLQEPYLLHDLLKGFGKYASTLSIL